MTTAIPPEYRDKPLIPWKEMEGALVRVNRFIPLVPDINQEIRRHKSAWDWASEELLWKLQTGEYTPVTHRLQFRKRLFALLEVECPWKLTEPSYMPVCHRFDFVKLFTLFSYPEFLDPDEEVLVGYPLACDTRLGSILYAFMPRLQVFVQPKGFLEWTYDRVLNREKADRESPFESLYEEYSYWHRTPRYLREK